MKAWNTVSSQSALFIILVHFWRYRLPGWCVEEGRPTIRNAKWAPGWADLLCKPKSCCSLVLSGGPEWDKKESLSLDIFQSARRYHRARSIYLHSPIVSPCSQIWGFLSIQLTVTWEAQVGWTELKANNRQDKTQRPACPWRACSLAERKPGEPMTRPAALEATAQESPLAATIKVNKNWKVIAYLLFPQLDTFPPQAQSIWRLFCLSTESSYLFDSL